MSRKKLLPLPNPASRKLGVRLRAWRHKICLSQDALAEVVGVTGIHISQIERGIRTPSENLCVRLASALEIDLPSFVIEAIAARDPEGADVWRSFFKQPAPIETSYPKTQEFLDYLKSQKELLLVESYESLLAVLTQYVRIVATE